MKPKILVITSTFPRWANDSDPPFVLELCKRFVADYDITVHTPSYHGALARETMHGIKVHRFRYCFSRFERLAGGRGIVPKLRRNNLYYLLLPFFLAAQCASFLLLVARSKPDIIHAHWLIPQGLLAVIAKKVFGVPVIITAHGADVFSMRGPLFIRLKKYIVTHADLIVTVSESLARVLMADTACTTHPKVISMGVDGALFTPEKKDAAIREKYGIQGRFLLYVGRLTEKKGVDYLIDAITKVVDQNPDSKLLIVGHGELESELKEKAEALGLQKIVCFVGGLPYEQLPPYYATADIFIGPSIQARGGDTEGFGLTFVEAAMSGCLLIGTRVGGVEDIIADGENGLLVPPADTEALAEKILQAVNNFDNLKQIQARGRSDAIAKFDWQVVAGRYADLFLNLTHFPGP
jgi:glycosyltransferase involved in cell wall biosynthesis